MDVLRAGEQLPGVAEHAHEVLEVALLPELLVGDFNCKFNTYVRATVDDTPPALRFMKCGACPVSSECRARKAGVAESLPWKPKKKRRASAKVSMAACVRNGRVLVVRRPATGLLAGMWGLPMVEEGGPEALAKLLKVEVLDALASWRPKDNGSKTRPRKQLVQKPNYAQREHFSWIAFLDKIA